MSGFAWIYEPLIALGGPKWLLGSLWSPQSNATYRRKLGERSDGSQSPMTKWLCSLSVVLNGAANFLGDELWESTRNGSILKTNSSFAKKIKIFRRKFAEKKSSSKIFLKKPEFSGIFKIFENCHLGAYCKFCVFWKFAKISIFSKIFSKNIFFSANFRRNIFIFLSNEKYWVRL